MLLFLMAEGYRVERAYEATGEYQSGGTLSVRIRQRGPDVRDAAKLPPTAGPWRPFRSIALATPAGRGFSELHHLGGQELRLADISVRPLEAFPARPGAVAGEFRIPPTPRPPR